MVFCRLSKNYDFVFVVRSCCKTPAIAAAHFCGRAGARPSRGEATREGRAPARPSFPARSSHCGRAGARPSRREVKREGRAPSRPSSPSREGRAPARPVGRVFLHEPPVVQYGLIHSCISLFVCRAPFNSWIDPPRRAERNALKHASLRRGGHTPPSCLKRGFFGGVETEIFRNFTNPLVESPARDAEFAPGCAAKNGQNEVPVGLSETFQRGGKRGRGASIPV